MEQTEVKITYETLFELLRREKNREELQPMEASFFADVVHYINEKKAGMDSPNQSSPFGDGEKDRLRIQLENIKKILRELYDRRENKTMKMAINESRTINSIIDRSIFLPAEATLFDALVSYLKQNRVSTIIQVIEGKLPDALATLELSKQEGDLQASEEPEEPEQSENKTIRFLSEVPQFVGKELENYGPFTEGQTAAVPYEIADLLIKSGKAEIEQ